MDDGSCPWATLEALLDCRDDLLGNGYDGDREEYAAENSAAHFVAENRVDDVAVVGVVSSFSTHQGKLYSCFWVASMVFLCCYWWITWLLDFG